MVLSSCVVDRVRSHRLLGSSEYSSHQLMRLAENHLSVGNRELTSVVKNFNQPSAYAYSKNPIITGPSIEKLKQ